MDSPLDPCAARAMSDLVRPCSDAGVTPPLGPLQIKPSHHATPSSYFRSSPSHEEAPCHSIPSPFLYLQIKPFLDPNAFKPLKLKHKKLLNHNTVRCLCIGRLRAACLKHKKLLNHNTVGCLAWGGNRCV